MRFKVLEERIKASNGNSKITAPDGRNISRPSRRQSFGGADSLSTFSSNGCLSRKNLSLKSGSLRSNSGNMLLKNGKISEANGLGHGMPTNTNDHTITSETNTTHEESENSTLIEKSKPEHEDFVSGMLYDMLQKEVISLRKACHDKDQNLKNKEDSIEVLYLIS